MQEGLKFDGWGSPTLERNFSESNWKRTRTKETLWSLKASKIPRKSEVKSWKTTTREDKWRVDQATQRCHETIATESIQWWQRIARETLPNERVHSRRGLAARFVWGIESSQTKREFMTNTIGQSKATSQTACWWRYGNIWQTIPHLILETQRSLCDSK